MRYLLLAAGLAVLLYAGLCALLFVGQRSLIYMPQPRHDAPGTTVLAFPVDGAVLQVTARPQLGARAVLYFGGNAEDVAASAPALVQAFPDAALYLPHYRSY